MHLHYIVQPPAVDSTSTESLMSDSNYIDYDSVDPYTFDNDSCNEGNRPRAMHYIQKEIISSLARRAPQRFSDLQPDDVPNNTFSYHLKKLSQAGYIQLVDGGYIATRKAMKTIQYVTDNDKRTGAPVFITAVLVTNTKDEVLLLERNKQPFVGWYGLPAGLIHQGEQLHDAARRELIEKTSIKAPRLQFAGVLDFQYLEQITGDLFVHTVAFIYTYRLPSNGAQLAGHTSQYGTLLWSNLDNERILPEVETIVQLAKKLSPVIDSISYDEPTMTRWTTKKG